MPPPITFQQPPQNQNLMPLVIALLVLNASGFLLLAILAVAPMPNVQTAPTSQILSKVDAIQAKLSSFEAQMKKIDSQTENGAILSEPGDVLLDEQGDEILLEGENAEEDALLELEELGR